MPWDWDDLEKLRQQRKEADRIMMLLDNAYILVLVIGMLVVADIACLLSVLT